MKDIRPLIPVNPKGFDELAESLLESQTPPNPEALNFGVNINKAEYVIVPQYKTAIGINESYKNLDFQGAHFALADNGLFMPTIPIFMQHYLNVKSALDGTRTLQYANNTTVAENDLKKIWDKINKNIWTWLDAEFAEQNGKLCLQDHIVIKDAQGNKTLKPNSIQPLEDYVRENCYADLIFNRQFLPTQKSGKQEYEQGKTIYFWQPVEDRVARFYGISDRAVLDCYWDPSFSDSVLGVVPCVRGI